MAVTDRTTEAFHAAPEQPQFGAWRRVETPVAFHTDAAVSLGQIAENGHWAEQAMCSGKTDLFFAQPGERDGRRNRREALAKAYCACCPVQELCLTAGRLRREHGVWGGENDEERAAAGYGPASPHRRAVAKAAREARLASESAVDRAS